MLIERYLLLFGKKNASMNTSVTVQIYASLAGVFVQVAVAVFFWIQICSTFGTGAIIRHNAHPPFYHVKIEYVLYATNRYFRHTLS